MKYYKFTLGVYETNTYLIETDKNNAILIDPSDRGTFLLSKLSEKNLTLSAIFLTHGHYDHTCAVPEVALITGAPVYICEKDAPMLKDPSLALPSGVNPAIFKPYTPDKFYKDGDVINIDELTFKIHETPGHTKGSVMIETGNILFTGDTLFEGTVGNTWGDDDKDFRTLIASIQNVLKKLDGDYEVCPGHGNRTTLDSERHHNPMLQEENIKKILDVKSTFGLD